MLSFVVSLLWLGSIDGLFVILFKRKFVEVLPLTLIGGVLFIYLCGFVLPLSLAYKISWLFVIFYFILLAYLFRHQKANFSLFVSNYFNLGFLIFVIIYFYLFFLCRNWSLNYWDEYMHWGPMVKEMFRIDAFYLRPASDLLVHQDYPPFFSILELLFCYFGKDVFQESDCYRAILCFDLTLFMPLFAEYDFSRLKDHLLSLLTVVLMVSVGLTVWPMITGTIPFYGSIYIDWPMAILCAYTLFSIYRFEKFGLYECLSLIILLSALLVGKQVGLALVLLAVLLLFLRLLMGDIGWRSFLPVAILPWLLLLMWKLLVGKYGIGGQFEITTIDFKEVIRACIGDNNSWQHLAFVNFIEAIKGEKLAAGLLAYFPLTFILSLLFIIISYRQSKKKGLLLSFVYLFGSFAYALMMLILYMSEFGEYEGVNLASFERYMFSYLLSGLGLLVYLTVENFHKHKNSFLLYLMPLSFLLFLSDFSQLSKLLPNQAYPCLADKVSQEVADDLRCAKEGRVLIIQQQVELNCSYPVINYINLNAGYQNYDYRQLYDLDYQDFVELLCGYKYIYLLYPDEYFIENYWDRLSDVPLLNRRLYEIDKNGENITLTLIDKDVAKYE